MIVDDQASIRHLIRAGLRGLGCARIREAEDGHEALAKMATRRPDVLLLDGNMPRLDGIGTLKAMRRSLNLKDVSVIMMTGRADVDFVRQTRELGALGYLIKPFSMSALVDRIDFCLSCKDRLPSSGATATG